MHPGLDFPRACRLVRRDDYDAVYRDGRRTSSREFTVFLRPNGLEPQPLRLEHQKGLWEPLCGATASGAGFAKSFGCTDRRLPQDGTL